MKLSANTGEFATALSLAATVCSNKNASSTAHLVAVGERLSIRCTDNAVGAIKVETAATVYEPGEIAVPVDRIVALVSRFAVTDSVVMRTTASGLEITSGNSRSRLPILTDLPAAITLNQEIGTLQLSCSEILTLLEPISAADDERTRFILSGIFWHSVDGNLVAVSTNGIRLVRCSVTAGVFSNDRRLILSAKAATALRRLMQLAKPNRVTIRRSRTLIAFETPALTLTTRLIDAAYPDYERIIPAPAPNSVLCDRVALLASLGRLLAAASAVDIALVALSWADGQFLDLFLARQPLNGADIIIAEALGTARVAVSLGQLAAILNEFSCKQLHLETANQQPLVIRGDGGKIALIARSAWSSCAEKQQDLGPDDHPSDLHARGANK